MLVFRSVCSRIVVSLPLCETIITFSETMINIKIIKK